MNRTSTALAALLVFCAAQAAQASIATWQPQASEKLVRMQPTYIAKALDRDFSASDLGTALADVNGKIKGKAATIADLKDAAEHAAGETKIELRHQMLAEKKEYLGLIGEQQDLRRRHAKTKMRVYGEMLRKLSRSNNLRETEAGGELVQKQSEARKRFLKSSDAVDLKLFGQTTAPTSKYSAEYAKNVAVIEQLLSAINTHPMNAGAEIDGQPVSKEEFLRQQVAKAETEASLIDQEAQIVGYMAKLVSLDAAALSDDLASSGDGEEGAAGEDGEASPDGVADAVSMFIPE